MERFQIIENVWKHTIKYHFDVIEVRSTVWLHSTLSVPFTIMYRMKLLTQFETSTVTPLKFENG